MTRPGVDVDEDAEFEQWVREGYDRAYRTACLILCDGTDVEQALQESYLRAWRFRHSLPSGEGRRPWLCRVLVNTCDSRLRGDIPRRDRDAGSSLLDDRSDHGGGPKETALHADRSAALTDALADLPHDLSVVVVLRYWSGLSEKEIGTAIQRRPGTVRSWLHEARLRLSTDRRLMAVVQDGPAMAGARR